LNNKNSKNNKQIYLFIVMGVIGIIAYYAWRYGSSWPGYLTALWQQAHTTAVITCLAIGLIGGLLASTLSATLNYGRYISLIVTGLVLALFIFGSYGLAFGLATALVGTAGLVIAWLAVSALTLTKK